MELLRLTKADLQNKRTQFCELYRKCFNDCIDEEIVIKRYINNPYDDLLMYAAIDDDRIVANYSATPMRVMVDGCEVKAALSINTMTDPVYEGRGLFVKLATQLYEYMIEEQYGLICGFPNYLSNGVFTNKLGWKDIYEYPTLLLDLSGKDEKNFELSDAVELLDTTEGLETKNESGIYVVKDSEYLRWRYDNHPTNKYHVLKLSSSDWLIYKFYGSEVNVVELCVESNEAQKTLINAICNIALEESKKQITVWQKINTREHSLFERLGFCNRAPIRYFSAKQLMLPVEADIFDARNWSIQMGDDNVY